jgi:hypothetical protein
LSYRTKIVCALFVAATLSTPCLIAQEATPTATPEPHGEVLFQSHGEPPPEEKRTQPVLPFEGAAPTSKDPELTDVERSALSITSYDLDARLKPADAHLSLRADIVLRNNGTAPLTRVALQISSTLIWDSVSLMSETGMRKLVFAQHLIDTDADHTGKASEAILTLPVALAPGSSVHLDVFYAGAIPQDATRLTRIGASPGQAEDTDWDAIGGEGALGAALRGFGNVLWYPVAAPQLFLGDGAKLFQAIAATRFAEQETAIHLHLAIEYAGEPPVAAYFCGRRQPLVAIPDDPNLPVANGSGIATADFAAEPLGPRLPSLFVVDHAEQLIAPLPPLNSPGAPMLAVETTDDAALPGPSAELIKLADSAQTIAPLLQVWFGPRPLSTLTVLDQRDPDAQPFEDGPLLVAPVAALASSSSSGALAHSLTHAFVQTGQPWMDEGLAQFMALLWTESQKGRDAALAEYHELLRPLALAEIAPAKPAADGDTDGAADGRKGEPIITASDELYYRRKSAAVFWMLRGIVGDEALAQALAAWRTQPVLYTPPEEQATAFEVLLEKTSGKDLAWFFSDWVLHDRGLPDLSIAAVEPRQLPAGKGHDSGWLVAVTVRNEGAAAADVPLFIYSDKLSTNQRLRIPGFSTITERVIVGAVPTQVVVGDGIMPEMRTSVHTRDVVAKTE